MPSFDIISEVESTELRNAVDNANRELATRFDFRNVEASFEFKNETVILSSQDDFQLKQMRDILRSNLTKRVLMQKRWKQKKLTKLVKTGTKT